MRIRRSVQLAAGTDDVRRALTAAETFLRCLPGATVDATGGDSAEGRFLIRIGGHQITYRGSAECTADERVSWRASAAQIRGEGEVSAALTFTTHADPGGSTLAVDARLTGSGRVADFDLETRRTAGERLLERLLQGLAQEIAQDVARTAAEPVGVVGAFGAAGAADQTVADDIARPDALPDARPARLVSVPDTAVALHRTRPAAPVLAAVIGSLGVLLFWMLRRMNIRH